MGGQAGRQAAGREGRARRRSLNVGVLPSAPPCFAACDTVLAWRVRTVLRFEHGLISLNIEQCFQNAELCTLKCVQAWAVALGLRTDVGNFVPS